MSDLIDKAVTALAERLSDEFDGSAKFQIEGEGAIMIDATGVRAADEPAEVTLLADAETFEGILSGDLNPSSAFMQGKLTVEGDMGTAMKLGAALG